jgi:crotonobetainyl-CoA:carnitine CoA-transferase CaiB-like acyl-CoA transferase
LTWTTEVLEAGMTLLDGVKIVEVANVITGPLAGMLLADLGAEVVKVEAPSGDPFRRWEAESDDVRPAFAAYNRGKRSFGLNLKDEQGRVLFTSLVASADVVIENSRPGVMDRLGLGWDVLRAVNPRLVYCYVSGMGTTGPDRDRPTYDAVAQALSGLWSQLTELAAPEPVGPPMADQLTGMYAAMAVLAALRGRDATGEGLRVEVSMLSSCLAFQAAAVADATINGKIAGKTSRARSSQSYAFVGSDGGAFTIHLSTPQKFWVGLCRAVGMPELAADERYVTKSARIAAYDDLRLLLAGVFATRPRDEWLEVLATHDVPAAPILTVSEAVDHPQVRAVDVVDRESGPRLRGLVRSPVQVDGRHCAADRPPPLLGEDTAALLDELRVGLEEQERLRAEGTIA